MIRDAVKDIPKGTRRRTQVCNRKVIFTDLLYVCNFYAGMERVKREARKTIRPSLYELVYQNHILFNGIRLLVVTPDTPRRNFEKRRRDPSVR